MVKDTKEQEQHKKKLNTMSWQSAVKFYRTFTKVMHFNNFDLSVSFCTVLLSNKKLNNESD